MRTATMLTCFFLLAFHYTPSCSFSGPQIRQTSRASEMRLTAEETSAFGPHHDIIYSNVVDRRNFPASSCTSNQRRNVLAEVLSVISAGPVSTLQPHVASALSPVTSPQVRQPTARTINAGDEPVITNKVQFKIRISRPDGSFYVRDDEDESQIDSLDRVFYCRLVFGLYGQDVPNHVQRFLSYCRGPDSLSGGEEDSAISYAASTLPGLDPASGLLQAGVVPSLRLTLAVAGSTTALEYRGRLMPATLWRDVTSGRRLSHGQQGLLTHARLDATPAFGITTRTDTRELDATHQVFGRILWDESDAASEFLDRVQSLPTYSLERPSTSVLPEQDAGDAVAGAIFSAQRNFFRTLAKNVGDSRIDKVYPGKFLRRLEVTEVSILT